MFTFFKFLSVISYTSFIHNKNGDKVTNFSRENDMNKIEKLRKNTNKNNTKIAQQIQKENPK